MPEYSVILTIELRLTGEFLLEANSIDTARAAVQEMLGRIDMDYTVYEGGVQSDDIFWEQESFEVDIREVNEVLEDEDDEPEEIPQ